MQFEPARISRAIPQWAVAHLRRRSNVHAYAILCLAALAVAGSAAAFISLRTDVRRINDELASARQARRHEGADAATAVGSKQNFVDALRPNAQPTRVLTRLQHHAAAAGVQVTGSSVAAAQPSTKAIGRHSLSISLRGSYPTLMRTVAGLLDDMPADLVLVRLAVRRLGTPVDLEASVELLLLEAPLPATSSQEAR